MSAGWVPGTRPKPRPGSWACEPRGLCISTLEDFSTSSGVSRNRRFSLSTLELWLDVLLDSESLYKTSRQVVNCSSRERNPAISCHVQRFSGCSGVVKAPASLILLSERRFLLGR